MPLVDKPLIQYVVEEAVSSGIEEVVLITGRGKRAIEDHFDVAFELEEDLKAKGKHKLLSEVQRIANMVTFCYIRQKKALGLGHAVLTAKRLVGDDPFAVLLGDDIIDAKVPGAQTDDGCVSSGTRRRSSPSRKFRNRRRRTTGSSMRKRSRTAFILSRTSWKNPLPNEAPSNLAIIGRYILTPGNFRRPRAHQAGQGRRDPAHRRAPAPDAETADLRLRVPGRAA